MVKMVGSYTRPEELLIKLANENTDLKKRVRELEKENSMLRQTTEEQQMELQYTRYYADEENYKECAELANLQSDDIVTYEEWFNSEASDKLIEAYAEYYN